MDTKKSTECIGREFKVKLEPGELQVWEYGHPDGLPVLYLHGWPSGGQEARMAHAAAESAHIRLIAPNRPGIGQSLAQKNRELRDWPPLVSGLADSLGWDTLRVLAISGGALYGYATAQALPCRVKALGILCGSLPLADLPVATRLHPAYRLLLSMYRRNPAWPRWLLSFAAPFARRSWPKWCLWPLLASLPEADRATLRHPEIWNTVCAAVKDAFQQSGHEVYLDGLVNAKPLPFELNSIQTPILFWHGKEDRNFHWQDAAAIGAQLPNAQVRLFNGQGHFSIAFLQVQEALAELARLG